MKAQKNSTDNGYKAGTADTSGVHSQQAPGDLPEIPRTAEKGKEREFHSRRAYRQTLLCPDHRTGHDSADGSEIHSENNKQLFAGK